MRMKFVLGGCEIAVLANLYDSPEGLVIKKISAGIAQLGER